MATRATAAAVKTSIRQLFYNALQFVWRKHTQTQAQAHTRSAIIIKKRNRHIGENVILLLRFNVWLRAKIATKRQKEKKRRVERRKDPEKKSHLQQEKMCQFYAANGNNSQKWMNSEKMTSFYQPYFWLDQPYTLTLSVRKNEQKEMKERELRSVRRTFKKFIYIRFSWSVVSNFISCSSFWTLHHSLHRLVPV